MSDWIYDEEGLIMKKMVGVMPLWDDEKESIWMLPAYMEGLKAAGMDSFIFPMTQDEDEVKRLVGLCDQILLTGGHDVNPSLYQEEPVNASVEWNETRDVMEERVISHALAQDMPVLGICRGLQILNVALGGTLYQDLPLQHPSDTDHHMTPPYDRLFIRSGSCGTRRFMICCRRSIWASTAFITRLYVNWHRICGKWPYRRMAL